MDKEQSAKTFKIETEIWDHFQAIADKDDRSLTYVIKCALQDRMEKDKGAK